MVAIDLGEVRAKAEQALKDAENDGGASSVLTAVVREFAAKVAKAEDLVDGERQWEVVVEVEQAGDSAKAAAEADEGAAEATKASVLAAHLAICMLKAEVASSTS